MRVAHRQTDDTLHGLTERLPSASLHGWVWIVCALGGTVIGIRLRRFFRLEG